MLTCDERRGSRDFLAAIFARISVADAGKWIPSIVTGPGDTAPELEAFDDVDTWLTVLTGTGGSSALGADFVCSLTTEYV